MWLRSWRQVNPAYKALAKGEADKALVWLSKALQKRQNASFQVQVAAVYALYDERGLEQGKLALAKAAKQDTSIQETALYKTIALEFDSIKGQASAASKKAIRGFLNHEEALVRFHAARSLLKFGNSGLAIKTLRSLNKTDLPVHLWGRCFLLLASAYSHKAKEVEAIEAFEEAINHLPAWEASLASLSIAESYMRLGEARLALSHLSDIEDLSGDLSQQVRKCYIKGVAHRHAYELEEAFHSLNEAYQLASNSASVPFELYLEMARLFSDMQEPEKANVTYIAAETVATQTQLSLLNHEYGVALRLQERFEKARTVLAKVVEDTRYALRAEACAELAFVEYELGNLELSQKLAEYALKHDVTLSACLCLGKIALEYFHLAEAETYFEQAVAASKEGEGEWLTAQLLLAETFAQRKADAPEKLIFHAEQALKYLHPSDEWVGTLRGYINAAQKDLKIDPNALN